MLQLSHSDGVNNWTADMDWSSHEFEVWSMISITFATCASMVLETLLLGFRATFDSGPLLDNVLLMNYCCLGDFDKIKCLKLVCY